MRGPGNRPFAFSEGVCSCPGLSRGWLCWSVCWGRGISCLGVTGEAGNRLDVGKPAVHGLALFGPGRSADVLLQVDALQLERFVWGLGFASGSFSGGY